MPSVAEVQFKATGQQTVVTAFKNVGDSAATTTTKISQNSSALKSMGTGMKSTVSSIGAVATSFATLSLSIVNTWRSYRDLEDTQIAVNSANLKLTNSIDKLNEMRRKSGTISKQEQKGSLKERGLSLDIAKAHALLKKAVQEHGKKSLEAALAQQKYNEAVAAAKAPNTDYLQLQKDIKDQEELVANNKLKLGEAQERASDAVQDFYLSIAPTAIGVIGSLATVVGTLKSTIGTGRGGLVGAFGGLGLILGAGALAITAYKNNWFGLKDALAGTIDWIKSRFDIWQKTIAEVFGMISKGDWQGAFNKIKEAAAKFWEDLKKSVPFFGGVATLVDQLSKGDWAGAFNTIRDAAVFFWTELKKAVPFFGTIETVIDQIKNGKWEEAFKTIGDSIMKGLQSILGVDLTEKIVLKFQLMKDSAYAELNLMKDALTKKGGPIDLINQGLAKLGSGDIVGGFTGIWTGFDKAVGILITRFNDWVKLNFGVDLGALETQAQAIGTKILDGIKSGLTFVARTWIDPVLTQLLDPQTWIQGFIAMGGFFVRIGTALYTAIGTALGNAAKDPKGATDWWGKVGQAIWDGLTTWFTANLPGATKAMQGIAQSLVDGVEAAKVEIQNIGIAIWNQIIEGIRAFTGGAASPFGGALDALKKNPIDLPVKPIVTEEGKTAIQTWVKNANPLEYPTEPDQSVMKKNLNTQLGKVFKRGGYVVPKIDVDANTNPGLQKSKALQNAINNMHATIKVSASYSGQARAALGVHGGISFQHGYQGTVKRPTMFLAGEGGRPEDVTVRPRGSVQRGGSGGGFNGTINVYVDGVLRPARYDMGARK